MAFHTEAELAEQPDLMESIGNVEDIEVKADTPVKVRALRLEPRFRLLLKLTGFTRDDSLATPKYVIPRSLPTDTISENADLVQAQLEQGPPDHAEYNFTEMIKKMKKAPQKKAKGGKGGIGRKGHEVKEVPQYHSTEYVVDSEDDDADEAYYRQEAALRDKHKAELQEAEERHRQQEEMNAMAKSQRAREHVLARMRTRVKEKTGEDVTATGEPASAAENIPDVNSEEGEASPASTRQKTGTPSNLDEESDISDIEHYNRIGRMYAVTDSDEDSEPVVNTRKPGARATAGSGGVTQPNQSASEDRDISPESTLRSYGTPMSRKRQIIVSDSEEEDEEDEEEGDNERIVSFEGAKTKKVKNHDDEDSMQDSTGPPPNKKFALDDE
ncbi:hypothetical protein BGZ94_001893 [Podila epigama]|nr:hypothetical protein BGZ94_001893 [Podila epigama]